MTMPAEPVQPLQHPAETPEEHAARVQEAVADAEASAPAGQAPAGAPPASALKAEHVDYAVSQGMPQDEAEAMTKAELTDQAAAGDLPDVMAQHEPDAPDTLGVMKSASNESPVLPPNLPSAAARAHGIFGHLIEMLKGPKDKIDHAHMRAVAEAGQKDLERYVPAEHLAVADDEAARLVRNV